MKREEKEDEKEEEKDSPTSDLPVGPVGDPDTSQDEKSSQPDDTMKPSKEDEKETIDKKTKGSTSKRKRKDIQQEE